ncbi:hypothetical protein PPERSA_07151 [Pseudocohnilembus persalinus]|uniref:D-glutamate cyclase-like C-terminal domain-containing protein n=1 Tax=Pseudocohnilembus persalinus TaxID=266149 RepID=A0A0V0QX85_PSEPJ|nr:hypothetical protein PPERSA_07151 [Pseudocohnilembus persalinus]|eukprot:KRX06988.1 hypothetical protein PPERSA_07151 [Pseudocohnilembus persalinus]
MNFQNILQKTYQRILQLIQKDLNNRGVLDIMPKNSLDQFSQAIEKMYQAKNIAILTGFQCNINEKIKAENDGINGSLQLGKLLQNSGKKITYLIDQDYKEQFETLVKNYQQQNSLVNIIAFEPELKQIDIDTLQQIKKDNQVIISIERPSITQDGKYYTMSAIDITDITAPIDPYLFENINIQQKKTYNNNNYNESQNQINLPYTIGIGDGGNEVGMGNQLEQVKKFVKNGDKIGAVTKCDSLLVCDISNWGAYGLLQGYNAYSFVNSYLKDQDFESNEQNYQQYFQLYQNYLQQLDINFNKDKQLYLDIPKQGFKDGILKVDDGSVDGQTYQYNIQVLEEIKNQFEISLKEELQ